MEESMEDFIALTSEDFIKSIEKAREDYRKGRVKHFRDVFNV